MGICFQKKREVSSETKIRYTNHYTGRQVGYSTASLSGVTTTTAITVVAGNSPHGFCIRGLVPALQIKLHKNSRYFRQS